jgi:hypothetical protein
MARRDKVWLERPWKTAADTISCQCFGESGSSGQVMKRDSYFVSHTRNAPLM